jgi:hypothetical protein
MRDMQWELDCEATLLVPSVETSPKSAILECDEKYILDDQTFIKHDRINEGL